MMDGSSERELMDRLLDAEARLTAIAELASSPVTAGGTPEANLADAEARLTQVLELARRDA
jgi:hypothetical protein